MLFVLKGTTDV